MQDCADFISAESLHMFRVSSAHHQEYLKLVQRPLVHVLSLQVSHHITILGTKLKTQKNEWQCRANILILLMMGA